MPWSEQICPLGCFLLPSNKSDFYWFNGKPISWQEVKVQTSKQNAPKPTWSWDPLEPYLWLQASLSTKLEPFVSERSVTARRLAMHNRKQLKAMHRSKSHLKGILQLICSLAMYPREPVIGGSNDGVMYFVLFFIMPMFNPIWACQAHLG